MQYSISALILICAACAAAPDTSRWRATLAQEAGGAGKSAAGGTGSSAARGVQPVRFNAAPVATTSAALQQTPGRAPERENLAARLASTQLPGFHVQDETDLRALMKLLADISGIPIFVQSVAQEAVNDADVSFNLHWDRPVSVTSILNVVAELSDDTVGWTLRHGLVLVTTPELARSKPRTTVIDISDLTFGVPSFAATEINVLPSGGISAATDDLNEPVPIMNEDMLIDLIRQTIAPDSWDNGRNSIRIQNGKLIITHD